MADFGSKNGLSLQKLASVFFAEGGRRGACECDPKTMPMSPLSSSRRFTFARSLVLLHLCSSRSSSFSTAPETLRGRADHASGFIPDPTVAHPSERPSLLSGDWSAAKRSLRYPDCCVVAVSGLDRHLLALRRCFCGDGAPADLDLRMRVRCGGRGVEDVTYEDCAKIFSAVMAPTSAKHAINRDWDENRNSTASENPCILALEELARGVASLADGPLSETCTDVHMRVACTSDYRAIDPMFHTDKCPLRGYVTLTGPGTEYMSRTCLPWEYAALRTFGAGGPSAVGGGGGDVGGLRMAEELEFIVMKGDYYDAPPPDDVRPSAADAMLRRVWDRSSACVHRSPPGASSENAVGNMNTRRRVILSLDLADGRDDQEWHEVSRRRGWRSGMTQRKSGLVS